MDLQKITEVIEQKRNDFLDAVQAEADKINLEDVLSEINIDPMLFGISGRYPYFSDGQSVNLPFMGNLEYDIQIGPDEIVLSGPYATRIKSFSGAKVRKFYSSMVDQIEDIQDNDDLAF